MTLDQLYMEYSLTEINVICAVLAAFCLFTAFFGFKFIKLEIILSAIAFGYDLGANTLGKAIGDLIKDFDAGLVLGIACAVLLSIFAIRLYRFYIKFVGGVLGFVLGFVIPNMILTASGQEEVGLIVGLVIGVLLAVLMAKLFIKAFKAIFIVSSSFAGSVFAAVFVAMIIFGNNEAALGASVFVGLVLAVVAIVAQVKMNRGKSF